MAGTEKHAEPWATCGCFARSIVPRLLRQIDHQSRQAERFRRHFTLRSFSSQASKGHLFEPLRIARLLLLKGYVCSNEDYLYCREPATRELERGIYDLQIHLRGGCRKYLEKSAIVEKPQARRERNAQKTNQAQSNAYAIY